MTTKSILRIIVWVSGIALATACSESTDPTPTTFYHAFTGNTQKSWVITNFVWIDQGKREFPIPMDQCEADDRYTFYANADRRYQVTNRRKCDTRESDVIVDDSWSFVNATSTLTIYIPRVFAGPVPFFVRSVTDSKIILEVYLDQESRYSARFTLTTVNE